MPTLSAPGVDSQVTFRELLSPSRELVDSALAEFLAGKRRAAAREAPAAAVLVDAVESLVAAGGKRLRPILVLETFRALGGAPPERALPAALATELLHAYLLIHDDIMDHAELRRGRPTAHVAFEHLHEGQGLSGDRADFGRSMAILAGDLAASFAAELFAATPAPAPLARRLGSAYAAMTEEVIWGQFLELVAGRTAQPSEADLLAVLRLKSGRYSVERPIELGALLAEAGEETLRDLAILGEALGEVFQLKDDLLGLFGDPERTGKAVGGDLLEGKFTFPLHHALTAAGPAERRLLAAVRGNPASTPDELARALDLIAQRGGVARVHEMIAQRLATARELLPRLPLSPAGRRFFEALIAYSEEREE
ncbi:MAG TPA: polyprenyl synthetase family protein [Thermoanaerobaculia bacterium]|nr:polyprenyl synthetase family protein [Thermoanaerobaculia bacterium]